ncbi:transforming growth factor beta activator LRRC32 [Brienomyrus brachyistius]|uniref:transforming growth factor beta activator LRRC32 n=1 Tax=Brienomyrus brachyistius TaxID=42636 RepID=UPI0020B320E4|nr:transforming growth factor beta activator LRRC32 [Brienomyrus brachyistius]XP_048873401.1 transforming growth factor beta activator LRRC32 [Brienomyrus brachyistius]XP_048873402.1 transforming growth factor beta activator LRRC32 [Brienomyrus brachyistius]
MGVHLWMLLAAINGVTATYRPWPVTHCRVVDRVANCTSRNLKTIPRELPPGIHELDLSYNLLQNLTQELMSSYTSVHRLNLHSNKIQCIQPGLFENMTNLQVLDLSRNDLYIIALSRTPVGPLSSVKKLDLSGNGLYTGMTDYFLEDAPALLNLSLEGNSITKITNNTFFRSKSLRNIDLHNNVILEIEGGAFNSMPHLSELDLSMNSITCITDFNLLQLKTLNLSQNSMESFQTRDWDREYELLYLDLRENKIHYFPFLPRRNKLIYLDLSRNLLTGVNTMFTAEQTEFMINDESRFTDDTENMYNNLTKLRYLDLSYNQIKRIPTSFFNNMASLEMLNLSNSCMEAFYIDQDSPLNSLKILDLSFNVLQDLSFGENTLQSLEELYLQANSLSVKDSYIFHRLPSIRDLHLQENLLKICDLPPKRQDLEESDCIILSNISTLHYLYLTRNSLQSLPQYAFSGSGLKVLDLSYNAGIKIDKNAYIGLETSLTYLSLRGNQLQMLNYDLSCLSCLQNLDVSTNNLTALPIWNKESSIESLNLQNNSLITLEYNTVQMLGKTLKKLYLGSNPLNCCNSLRFLQMVQKSTVDIPDIATVMCQYTQDSKHIEINIARLSQEHCATVDQKIVYIIIIIITLSLILVVVLVLLSKICHTRAYRLRGSYKA